MLNKNLYTNKYVNKIKMKSSINESESKNVKKMISNVKDNIYLTKNFVDEAKYIQVRSDNNDTTDKLNKISEKIEDNVGNINNIDVRSHKLNDIETSFSLIEEIIEDTEKIYNESISIGKETKEVINDIKSHENTKLKHDVDLLIENSKEIVKDTREIVNDFRNFYKIASSLIPFTIWGIYAVINKRPK